MDQLNRRRFLEVTAAAAVGARGLSAGRPAPAAGKPMRLGLIIGIGKDPESAIAKVHDLGLPTCQVGVESFEPELVTALRSALDRYGIEATSLVVGGPGPEVYDFYQGPLTIGLVPVEDPTSYGLVETGADGAVRRFLEKPRPEEVTTNLVIAPRASSTSRKPRTSPRSAASLPCRLIAASSPKTRTTLCIRKR